MCFEFFLERKTNMAKCKLQTLNRKPTKIHYTDGTGDRVLFKLWAHVVLTLLFVKFTLFLRRGVLILLVLRNEIVHIALGFCELHLVHAFARVPVQKSLAPEHRSEVLGYSLEHFLDSRTVAQERHRHFQALWRDVTHGSLNVVWNPFDEI